MRNRLQEEDRIRFEELDRLELELHEHYKKMTKELAKLQEELEEMKKLLNKKVGK